MDRILWQMFCSIYGEFFPFSIFQRHKTRAVLHRFSSGRFHRKEELKKSREAERSLELFGELTDQLFDLLFVVEGADEDAVP